MAEDLAEQFQQKVVRRTRSIINMKMERLMKHAADKIVNSPVMKAVGSNEFNGRHNVTGNMYMSTTAAVFYTGKDKQQQQGLRYFAQPKGPDPTRSTLAVNETYDLAYNYNGDPSVDEEKGQRPYRGQYGDGGQDGPFAGYQASTEDVKIPKRNVWTLNVAVGVDYANFNFHWYPEHNYMIALRDYVKSYWRTLG